MNNKDVRVVEMRFDNQQFESGVRTSMSTLDKLKEKLKLGDAADGLKNIGTTANSLNFSNLDSNVQSLADRFSTMGIVGQEVLRRLTNVAMDAGRAISDKIINPIFTKGWSRASNIEAAKFQIRGLGHEWSEVSKQIDYGVKDTAYGLDSAARAASQLVASGVQIGETFDADAGQIDELGMTLRAISGTAAMANSDYDSIAHIFTTVAGQGKVMTMQLRQLEGRGLNAAAELAKALNTSEQEVRDMVTAGKIDFATFASAMDNAFGQHAKDANMTFDGAMRNIGSAMARIGEIFAAPLIDSEKYETNAIGVLNAIRTKFNEIKAQIAPIAEPWERFVNYVGPKIISIINGIDVSPIGKATEQFAQFLNKITGFTEVIEENPISKELGALVGTTSELWKAESDAASAAEDAARKSTDVVKDVAGAIRTVTEEEAQAAWDIWRYGTYGNGEERRRKLAEVGLEYQNVQDYVNALYYANFDLNKVEIQVAESGKEGMEQVATAVTEVEEAVQPVSKGFLILSNIVQTIKNVFTAVGQVVRSAFTAFTQVFTFERTTEQVVGITDALRRFSERLILSEDEVEKFTSVFRGVFSVFSLIFDAIKSVAKVLGRIFIPVFSTAFNWVLSLAAGIGDAINRFREWVATSTIVSRAFEAISSVFNRIRETVRAVKDRFTELFTSLKTNPGIQRLADSLGRLWDVIKNFAYGIFDRIVNRIEAFGSAKSDFSFLDKLVELLGKAAGSVADFIDSLLKGEDPITKFFNSIADSNPLQSFSSYIENAKSSIANFFTGIDFSNLNILKKFGEAITNFFTNNLDISGKIGNIRQSITNTFDQAVGGININEIVEKIKGFFSKINDALEGVDWRETLSFVAKIATLIEGFKLIQQLAGIGKSIKGIGDSISGFFKSWSDAGQAAKKMFSAGAFIGVAIGIIALAGAMWILSKIPADKLESVSVVILGALTSALGMIAIVNKMPMAEKKMISLGLMFAGIGGGLLLIATAARQLAAMSSNDLGKSISVISGLIFIFSICARNAGNVGKGGLVFAGMAWAIKQLVPAFYDFAAMDWNTILKGGGVIVSLMIMMGLAARVAGGGGTFGAGVTILAMGIAIRLLVPALKDLSMVPFGPLAKAAGVIAVLAIALGFAANLASKGGGLTILALAVTLAVAAISLKSLAELPWEGLLAAGLALAGIMVAVGFAAKTAQKSEKPMIIMAVVIGLLAFCVYQLAQMPLENIAAAGGVLGVGLYSLSKAIQVLSAIPFGAAMKGLLNLLAIVGILGVVAWGLGALVNGTGKFGQSIVATIEKGGEVLTAIGEAIGGFVGGLVGGAIGGIAQGVTDALPKIAENLSNFMEKLQGFIDGAKQITWSVFNGVTVLAACVAEIGTLEFLDSINIFSDNKDAVTKFGQTIVSLGNYMSVFSEVLRAGKFNSTLTKSAGEAGLALASFVNEIPTAMGKTQSLGNTNKLVEFGNALMDFGPNFAGFAASVEGIEIGHVESAAKAASVLAEFANAIPNQGGKWAEFWGDNTMGQFAEGLKEFGPAFNAFSWWMQGVDTNLVEKASAAAESVAAFATKIPNDGGALGILAGNNSIDVFGEKLKEFGKSFNAYSFWVKGVDIGVISVSTAAAESVAAFATKIPNQGGALGLLVGDNKLSKFGEELSAFGRKFNGYSFWVKGVDVGIVEKSSAAADTVVEFASKISTQYCASLGAISSSGALADFGEEMASFGPNFADYADSMTNISPDIITSTSAAAQSIVDMANSIDTSQVWDLFKGDKSLGTFGENLRTFGEALVDYSDAAQGLDEAAATKANNVGYRAISMASTINTADISAQLPSFGDMLVQYADKLKGYSSNLSAVNWSDLTLAFDQIRKFKDLGSELSGTSSSLTDFVKALETAAGDAVTAFINAFKDSHTQALNAVNALLTAAMPTGSSKTNLYKGMKQSGIYALQGLYSGLNDPTWTKLIREKAEAIGRMVKQQVDKGQEAGSPSKALRQSGVWAMQGLYLGIVSMEDVVKKEAYGVGESIVKAMSMVSNADFLGETNINPVITPVLDLTDVQNGANSINSLFAAQSISLSNQNGISFNANQAALNVEDNQTVSLDDSATVEELSKLRNDVYVLADAISKMSVQLDSGALVGQLVRPMDEALGRRASMAGRGVI